MTQHDTHFPHLDERTVARYLDGPLKPGERASVEAHLAGCAECLDEVLEVRAVLRTRPRHRWKTWVPLAAAAALLVWVGLQAWQPKPSVLRDPAFTTTLAPNPVAPLGAVARAESLIWSSVPGARRYRITLFSPQGDVLWQALPADTAVALPDSLRLAAGEPYFWQVKAETGYGRWVESDLESFTLTAPR